MLYRCLLLCMLSLPLILSGQDLAGSWQGTLRQNGQDFSYRYNLELEINGNQVQGIAQSVAARDSSVAKFSITGYLEQNTLTLQEVQQLEPAGSPWCLKYITLRFREEFGRQILEGSWKASGCTPGTLTLERFRPSMDSGNDAADSPFSVLGDWSGTLRGAQGTQFLSLELKPGGKGFSRLTREGAETEQERDLYWRYDQDRQVLEVQEVYRQMRSNAAPRWCIRSSTLRVERNDDVYALTGAWSSDPALNGSGAAGCDAEQLQLEKPILTRKINEQMSQYQSIKPAREKPRKINVIRTIKVRTPQVKLRVWDNGTVDGDVATLFLNGEKVLEKYRVNSRKATLRVTLKEKDNFLVLHADDLGDIHPNTVAISIDDGTGEQLIIVSSNLQESGAILIKKIEID